MCNIVIKVDNRWVVPYSPLLSKTFKAHINVEYCNSVKVIKYICRYVTEGSDMAVFVLGNESVSIEKSNNINWDVTLVAMKLFGVFYHFQFMNAIQQLFIWQYILKIGSACNTHGKCTYKSIGAAANNFNCFFLIVHDCFVRKNTTLLRSTKILHMGCINEKVSTS